MSYFKILTIAIFELLERNIAIIKTNLKMKKVILLSMFLSVLGLNATSKVLDVKKVDTEKPVKIDMELNEYQNAITLYQSLKGAKPNLIRLFLKKQSKANEEKLQYELSKLAPKGTILEAVKPEKLTKPIVLTPQKETSKAPNQFYKLNQLHTSLHEKARCQRDLYQKATSLKLQLNEVHDLEENKALNLALEIENCFDEINAIQNILSHYVTHKVVLNLEKPSFKDLTPAQLLQRRTNKRANKTKVETAIVIFKENLNQTLSIAQKTKTENLLQKKEEKLLQLDIDIVDLTNLINS